MNSLRRVSFNILVALFVMSAAIAGYADDDDPPSRVARLKYVSGDVSVQPGGVDDWVLASVNRPLTTADRVWTDRDARAELHLGTAVMRMNHETSIALTNLTDDTVQVAVYQGTLNLRIKSLYKGEIYEVDTPNVAFTITKSGEYRFDVDANNDTTFVIVRKGEGVATGDGPAVKVKKDQYARFSGSKSLDHSIGRSPALDGFDEWCRVRDSRETYYNARRYVSPYTIGYEDLDGYGDWHVAVGYGAIWYPRHVVAGWTPYRYGRWVWINPWGWTWVDDAPWGFAPFHYGRWVHYRNRWGWCPGPIRYRPYYAPALVAWVGGSHFSIGFSIGGPRVGWFPLGYGEPYIPYRRVSRRYFQQVNITNTHITNVTNITNIYNNTYIDNSRNNIHIHNNNNNNNRGNNNNIRVHNNNIRYANYKVRDAVTTVDRDTMVRGKPVHERNVKFDSKDMNDRDVRFSSDVTPGRESVLGGRVDRQAPRPQGVAVKQVKEKMAPPQRASFEERRRAIERDINRPTERQADDRGRSNDRQAVDNRVPRPGRSGEVSDNGNGRQDPGYRGRAERITPNPADRGGNASRDAAGDSSASDRKRDLPASVPRPPRRMRDEGPTSRIEAKTENERAPRPGVRIGDGSTNSDGNGGRNGNGGNNGRDARDQQMNGPGNSNRGNGGKTPVPRPLPAERGSAVESPRHTPAERPDSRPVPSPRNDDRFSSPGRVENQRPEGRVERAPRPEPQSRPDVSGPSRPSDAPRMESPRPQPQSRPDVSAPRSEAPRVERQAPPASHGNSGGGGGGGHKGGGGGGKDRGGDQGGKDRPDGKR